MSLSDDKRVVTLGFVGAPEYKASNPCAMEYTADSEVVGSELQVAVFERWSPVALPLVPPMACPAVGASRSLAVELEQPFHGSVVRDGAGYVFFVAPPDGLAQLASLGAEWRLVEEHDVEESRSGRWVRVYLRTETAPRQSAAGRLDFYQSFGEPVNVTGTNEEPDVEINGRAGQMWAWPETGELVLAWRVEGDGLALVANEADFNVEQLVALAESATLPD